MVPRIRAAIGGDGKTPHRKDGDVYQWVRGRFKNQVEVSLTNQVGVYISLIEDTDHELEAIADN